jgi:hypothetical protein
MPSDRRDPGSGWYRRVPRWALLLVALCLAVAITLVVIDVVPDSAPDVSAPYTVVYSVTGTVSAADISWYVDAGAGQPISDSVNDHALPWSRTTVVTGAFPTLTLTAMASTATASGALTCKITVDGALRSRQTLTGAEPSVACDDSETGS